MATAARSRLVEPSGGDSLHHQGSGGKRLPLLVALKMPSLTTAYTPLTVARTFSTQQSSEIQDDDEEEEEEEEDVVQVTLPIKRHEQPEEDVCTQATFVQKRSTSTAAPEEIWSALAAESQEVEVPDDDDYVDETEPATVKRQETVCSRDEPDDDEEEEEEEEEPPADDDDEQNEADEPEQKPGSSVSYLPKSLAAEAEAAAARKISLSSAPAKLDPAIVGAKIKEYARICTVGTGTFGRVYLVQHRQRGAYYAMKVLNIRKVIRSKQIEHVHSEKKILQQVNHPFIIKLHWAYYDTRSLYMLFDYMPGGELFSYLRCAGQFCVRTSQFYSAEIVMALEYLHHVNVVYRDLKPENLLLDKDGHLRLTDFGFAKMLTDSRTWTMCGTPEYLAPEVIEGKGHNKAVDWWSLGVLVYEMLTGYTPFEGDNPLQVYEKILEGKPKFPKGFDKVAKDMIKRLLVINRIKRLGNMKGGTDDVKCHAWFAGINWEDCYNMKLKPPIVPTLSGEGDTGNFDEYDEDDSSQISDATSDDLELFEDW